MNQVKTQRERISKVLQENVFPHQRSAANKIFSALDFDCRTVIMAAEMQSGKSGVALALACLQRNKLTDEEITNQSMLKDTMYILTMPDTALLAQAKEDLSVCMNVVVTNSTAFIKDLDVRFTHGKPKLIIIDECHYGSSEDAIRYEKVFDYIENKNQDCSVVFMSATPLSALLAAENEAILRKRLKTKLVFHKASEQYHGIRKMLSSGQVIALNGRSRNLMNTSTERARFFEHIRTYANPGWVLVRVPSGSAMDAKRLMIDNGFDENNIFILGRSLNGVPEQELIDIEQFKIEYEQGILFEKKIIAITVASVRAGTNFGQEMKENLVATWDSTVSNVAAIVQANIGRACGYHTNKHALHFTNYHGVKAYSDIIDYLERNCTASATDDLDGLRHEFENICGKHEIRGLDVGARVNKGLNRKIDKKIFGYKAYDTDSYLVVPGRLDDEYDYSSFTNDTSYLSAISALREILRRGGIIVKSNRAVQTNSNIVAAWVNGDTYSNPEKAIAGGPASERVINFTTLLDQDQCIRFNDIVPAGGGIDIKSKDIAAFIFSIYNKSRRNVVKKVMTQEDVNELADFYNVASDNTIFVLFKKGDFNQQLTNIYIDDHLEKAARSKIIESNKFQRDYS